MNEIDYSYNQYQTNLDNNIELRKAVAKLEDLLTKKHNENEMLTKVQQDLKFLNEKIRKECSDLNHKLVLSYNDRRTTEKKYDSEIAKLKSYFEKQKEIYENQLLKLSAQDSEMLNFKITAEVELKHRNILAQKDIEIDNLNDQIFEWKKKFELMNTEYDSFKHDYVREIEILKENHKSEVKEFLFKIQLLNEKSENNHDKESLKILRHELDAYRRNFNDLQTEITNLRKEKDLILNEKNDIKINYLKDLDQEKMKNKILANENEKLNQKIKNLENEILGLKSKLEERNEELKLSNNDKYNLVRDAKFKESDYEGLKSELKLMKKKTSELEKENEVLLARHHEMEKARLMEMTSLKEESRKRIDDTTNSLREAQSEYKVHYEKANEEIHACKRDFYTAQEEKRNLIKKNNELLSEIDKLNLEKNKVISNQSELDAVKKSLTLIEEENKKLKHQNEKKDCSEDLKNYKLKYSDVLKKKKYYKQQLSLILNKLKKQFELNNIDLDLDFNTILDENEDV